MLKYFYLLGIISLIFGMGVTFILLDFIDEFGFQTTGFLMAVMFFVQFLTDYPSGSLGDYIGQRYVISLSLIFFGSGYLLISIFEGYPVYLFSSILFGLGIGQMSGAIETYLDNNYKWSIGNEDGDRKIYGFASQRIGTIVGYLSAISFIIGGILSTLFSRKLVFSIVGILGIFLIPFIIKYLKDITPKQDRDIENSDKQGFFFYLKGGLSYFFSSKNAFFLLLGISIINLADIVWFALILFPLYFAYSGSDAGVGSLRAIIFIIGATLQIYTAKYSKKIGNDKFGITVLIYYILWLPSIILLLIIIPPSNSFDFIGSVLLVIIFIYSVNGIGAISFTIRQRILSIKIPSENRNSIYSLLPTISILFQIPMLIYTGIVMETGGLRAGIEIVLIIGIIGSILIYLFHIFDDVPITKESE